MALIKCPECGKEVSDKAKTCPNCGIDIEQELKRIKQEEINKAYEKYSARELAQIVVDKITGNNLEEAEMLLNVIKQNHASDDYGLLIEAAKKYEEERKADFYSNICALYAYMLDYLDYPIDAMVLYSSLDLSANERMRKGFLLVGFEGCIPNEKKYTNILFNIEVENVIKKINLADYPEFKKYGLHNGRYNLYICTKNMNRYHELVKKSSKFFTAYPTFRINYYDYRSVDNTAGMPVSIDDLRVKERSEKKKEVQPLTLEEKQALLHAAAQTFSYGVAKKPSKPMDSITSAAIGNGLAGAPGAIIGYLQGEKAYDQYVANKSHYDALEADYKRSMAEFKSIKARMEQQQQDDSIIITATYLGYSFAGPFVLNANSNYNADKQYFTFHGNRYANWYLADYIRQLNESDYKFRKLLAMLFIEGNIILNNPAFVRANFNYFEQNKNCSDFQESLCKLAEDAVNLSDDKDVIIESKYLLTLVTKRNVSELINRCNMRIGELDKKEKQEALEAKKRKYAEAQNLMSEACDEETFLAAKKLFDTVEDYADSKEQSIACFDKAETCRKDSIYESAVLEMQKKDLGQVNTAIEHFKLIPGWKDADEKLDEANKIVRGINRKKTAIKTSLIVGGVAAFILLIIFDVLVITPNNNYKKFLNACDVENQNSIIESMKILKDKQLISADEELFNRGVLCLENDDYSKAKIYFDLVTDNSNEIIYEKYILAGENKLNEGDTEAAKQLFNYAGTEGKKRIEELDYQEALDLKKQENFEKALVRFKQLGEYKDCKSQVISVEKILYEQVMDYIDKQDYESASRMLTIISDYEEADYAQDLILYQQGLAEMKKGNIEDAIDIFEQANKIDSIEGMKDSLQACYDGIDYIEATDQVIGYTILTQEDCQNAREAITYVLNMPIGAARDKTEELQAELDCLNAYGKYVGDYKDPNKFYGSQFIHLSLVGKNSNCGVRGRKLKDGNMTSDDGCIVLSGGNTLKEKFNGKWITYKKAD